MTTVIDWLLLAPLAYVAIEVFYLVVTTLAAALYRKRPPSDAPPLRFAIVVPAHNEALGITSVVEQLHRADYPRDRFEVVVLADNCDDDTAALARKAGATVLERNDPDNPGKGQVLDWCFKSQSRLTSEFDAIAIVDADTTVDPRFLPAMAASFADPAVQAVQGRHGVANPEANWRTALVFAAFTLINHTRPTGRASLRSTAGLNGNGMAFRTDLIAKYGWPAQSIVEDVEFSVQLLRDGIRTHYCPEAVVTTPMPTTRAQSGSQRRRWELGRLQVARLHVPGLLARFVKRPWWPYLDTIFDLLVPPLSMFVMAQVLLLLLTIALRSTWWPLAAACFAGTCLHVALGLLLAKVPARIWLCLLAVPLFLLWKIPIYIAMALRPKQTAWVRTAREGETEQEPKQ